MPRCSVPLPLDYSRPMRRSQRAARSPFPMSTAQTFVPQTNVAGTNGTFSIAANGAWTYIANSAFDNLNVGQSVSDSFTVASADGTTSTVQVTINGTNDAAVLS